MKLYLIRHGESEGNVNRGFISGRSDPKGLTIKGKSQITRTAWELRKTEFDHIYHSPVVRAAESATILSDLLQIKTTKEDFLQEMSYGKFEGHFFWDMMDEMRPAFERWNQEFTFPFPGGESLEMVSNRVWDGYQQWIKTIDPNKKSNIIFVSHDAIISTLLFCLMYGHPASKEATASYKKAFMQFVHGIDVPNGSVYIIDLHAKPIRFHLAQLFKQPIPVNTESISFYIRGLQKQTITIKEKITASENQVFHLKDGHDSILKLMKEKEIVSSNRIISIYKYLKSKTSIEAPKVLLYDKTQTFFSETVILQDYQEGEDQRELLIEKNCPKALLRKTYEMLQKIHSIPVSDVEEFWYPDDLWHKVHISWSMYMTEEIDVTIKMLSKSIKNKKLCSSIMQSLKRLRIYITTGKTKLVPLHGDFAPQNIVVSKDGKMRVLDFERARIGDPLWDYAYYYGWLERADKAAAIIWKELIAETMDEQAIAVLNDFTVLFHAWTARDMFDYKKNSIRAQRAEKSIKILEDIL